MALWGADEGSEKRNKKDEIIVQRSLFFHGVMMFHGRHRRESN